MLEDTGSDALPALTVINDRGGVAFQFGNPAFRSVVFDFQA